VPINSAVKLLPGKRRRVSINPAVSSCRETSEDSISNSVYGLQRISERSDHNLYSYITRVARVQMTVPRTVTIDTDEVYSNSRVLISW